MSHALRGGCFCGQVRFEADDVFDTGYCHCSICRRFSGAPAVAWANTPAARFRVTRGSPRGFASSDHWVRFFCPACGAPVYGRHPAPPADDSDLVCFLIPSLDDPDTLRPAAHIWCDDRLPWFDTADTLPRFPSGELSHPRERRPPGGSPDPDPEPGPDRAREPHRTGGAARTRPGTPPQDPEAG